MAPTARNGYTGSRILGLGTALGNRHVTNDDFAKYLDTSDAWITERTGIKSRYMGGTSTELAIAAGRKALENTGVDPTTIDAVLLATSTPDRVMPPISVAVQHALGITGMVLDLNVACTGFVTALELAHGILATGPLRAERGPRRALVIGADTLSAITDQNDRSTAVLFGDGAGALVLEASATDHWLGSHFGSDPSTQDILSCEKNATITMTGREVYRVAVTACVESITAALQAAQVDASAIRLFVPHQANVRIMHAVSDRLGIPHENIAVVLGDTGNTSAASIPLALERRAPELERGDVIVLCGFGAGMAWGTQVWHW